jgi:hypothetical protein
MATFSIPDDKGKIIQPNSGNSLGNVFASYGLDLDTNRGKIRLSAQVKEALTDADDADFAGYAAAIVPYSGDLYAVSDFTFKADIDTPTTGWTKETAGTEPDVGNTITDAVVFDGLLLVADATDIHSYNGTTWSGTYWTSTLGQSALQSGERHLMKVGSDGNLYIVDNGNKLYKVHPVSGATVTGAGTLDFSATSLEFTALATTSTRLWIGCKDTGGNFGAILEWDMSAESTAVNRIHEIQAEAVRCIAVWNDVPYAVLSDGRIKYFNGVNFVDYEGFEFPVAEGQKLSADFIHPNGWDIIDDLPHFLVTGRTATQTEATATREANWAMPAGVWCMDPKVGLYCRFPIGTGESTQEDYGKPTIKQVGALFAMKSGRYDTTKFLASYEYYLDNGSTARSVLAYYDNSNSQATRGWLVTPFATSLREQWKLTELFHEPLPANAKINVYHRSSDEDGVLLSGTWVNTTTFNAVATLTGIEAGDLAYIKGGPGSNQWIKVAGVSESSTVTSLVLAEANSFATGGDVGAVQVFNFKYMGTISDTTRDHHDLAVPTSEKKRKRQFLFEIIQPASTSIEIDYIIIST